MDAPETVLKTAGPGSATVHRRPPQFEPKGQDSAVVRRCPLSSAMSAVVLAVFDAGCATVSVPSWMAWCAQSPAIAALIGIGDRRGSGGDAR